MTKFWRKSGSTRIVVGATGKPLDCPDCPCTDSVGTGTGTDTRLSGTGSDACAVCPCSSPPTDCPPRTMYLVWDPGVGPPCGLPDIITLNWDNAGEWKSIDYTMGTGTVRFAYSCTGQPSHTNVTGTCLTSYDLPTVATCNPFALNTLGEIVFAGASCPACAGTYYYDIIE